MPTHNALDSLIQTFEHTIRSYAPECTDPSAGHLTLNVDPSRQQFGDLSSHAALILAKIKKKSPQAIAEDLIKMFHHPLIERVEIAGAGFINITFTQDAYSTLLKELVTEGNSFFQLAPQEHRHNFSVEFVSANPTGPLHIGHGRNGIIGDTFARVAKFLGHQVTAEFYINDAGNQMTNLAQSIRIRCMQALGQDVLVPEEAYHGSYITDLAQECLHDYGPAVIEKEDAFFADYAKSKLLAGKKQDFLRYVYRQG